MTSKVVPLNAIRHAGMRLRALRDYRFASKCHMACLFAQEFTFAFWNYPILFVGERFNSGVAPVALLGLEERENLFLDAGGQLAAQYVPAVLQMHPFSLTAAAESGRVTVCVDESSARCSQTEGDAIFDAEGRETALLENVKHELSKLQHWEAATSAFVEFLVEHQLLMAIDRGSVIGARLAKLGCCHIVSEQRLNALDDSTFLRMRSLGYLTAVFSHLASLTRLDHLVTLKEVRQAGGAMGEIHPAVMMAGTQTLQ